MRKRIQVVSSLYIPWLYHSWAHVCIYNISVPEHIDSDEMAITRSSRMWDKSTKVETSSFINPFVVVRSYRNVISEKIVHQLLYWKRKKNTWRKAREVNNKSFENQCWRIFFGYKKKVQVGGVQCECLRWAIGASVFISFCICSGSKFLCIIHSIKWNKIWSIVFFFGSEEILYFFFLLHFPMIFLGFDENSSSL